VAIVHAEAQRADQPQFGPERHAGPAHITGVVGYLGLIEDDEEYDFTLRFQDTSASARRSTPKIARRRIDVAMRADETSMGTTINSKKKLTTKSG
jgi:hypothetical protein